MGYKEHNGKDKQKKKLTKKEQKAINHLKLVNGGDKNANPNGNFNKEIKKAS